MWSKIYQRIKPCPELSQVVESIWIQESDADASKKFFPPTRILPTGKVHIVFHYGDPFVQHDRNFDCRIPDFMVFGQTTKPVTVSATGRTGILIACLHPWGAVPLLGAPVSEFTEFIPGLTNAVHSKRDSQIYGENERCGEHHRACKNTTSLSHRLAG